MSEATQGPVLYSITDQEFEKFRTLIYDKAGISMTSAKKSLVVSRLSKRLRALGLTSFGQYYEYATGVDAKDEMRMLIDLLTTNETYFFRESRHFEFLAEMIKAGQQQYSTSFRVWSAASSTGEEAYTAAMFIDNVLAGKPFEVLGTDISTRVLKNAERGHYTLDRIRDLPKELLHKYCLQGFAKQEGTVLVKPELKRHVKFKHLNLHEAWPGVGLFDVIFLRNVMIYFDTDTKRRLVSRLLGQLKPDGCLIVGHSESLNGIVDDVVAVQPSIYKKKTQAARIPLMKGKGSV